MGVCRLFDSDGNCISMVEITKEPKYYVLVTTTGTGFMLVQHFHKLIGTLVTKLRDLVGDENVEWVSPLCPNNSRYNIIREPTRQDFIRAHSDDEVFRTHGAIFNYGHGALNMPALLFTDRSQVSVDDIENKSVNINADIVSKHCVCHQNRMGHRERWKAVLPNATFHFPIDINDTNRTPEKDLLPQFLNDLVDEINKRHSSNIPHYEYKRHPSANPNNAGCINFKDGGLACNWCSRPSCTRCKYFKKDGSGCLECVDERCLRTGLSKT